MRKYEQRYKMNATKIAPILVEKVDRKGITSYLLITFVLTYAIEAALVLSGFRWDGVPPILAQYVVMGVMWVPALATVLTIKFVTKEGFGITNLRFGAFKPYLVSALLIPFAFILTYGLTWLLGLGQPDWNLTALIDLALAGGADPATMPTPGLLIAGLFFFSILVGPTINGIFGFGEELGWRGYLLPKLMPLGKVRAYLAVGIIWGLWHAPLILMGFNFPGYPIWGILAMCGMTTAIGIYMNEMTLRYKSSILAGSIHGAFNGQGYGIWRQLFPSVNPLIGGMTGLVGMFVYVALGLYVAHQFATQKR